MPSEKIQFSNRDGHSLAARLEQPPSGRIRSYAIFAHCFTCTKNLRAVRTLAESLTDEGIAVLSFDFTGLGESEGDFADTNFTTNVSDLIDAADFLQTEYAPPEILVGHSLGGAAVLRAAGEIDSVRAVAAIAAPHDPGHVRDRLKGADKIEELGEAEVDIGGRSFRLRKQFLDDIAEQKMDEGLAKLKRALLIFHSPTDEIVGVDNASKIFTAAKHPKSFVSLDGADHLLSRKEDAAFVGNVLGAWAGRYIQGGAELPELQTTSETAVRSLPDSFTTDVVSGPHRLVADEPQKYGGADRGPSPYEFMSVALGSCTAMTINMYAARKKLPLRETRVHLNHRKIHAEDCADCETEGIGGKVDEIERIIELDGDLNEEQRQKLLEIADKCPVHRTLHSEIKIRSRLAD